MASSRPPLLFPAIFIIFSTIFINFGTLNSAQLWHDCSTSGNYTANSIYKSNLNKLLSSLASNNEIDYGFYNVSEGQNTDKVNAIALCKGDRSLSDCRSCVNTSTYDLPQLCPTQKEAIIWYDDCMLRYSNRSIFNSRDSDTVFYMRNSNNVSDPTQFNPALDNLLSNLTNDAASGDSTLKFAVGLASPGVFEKVYALVQCTPDLSEQDCVICLNEATSGIPTYLSPSQGGRIFSRSCNFRYESYSFYNTAPPPPPSPPPPSSPPPSNALAPTNATSTEGEGSNTGRTIILIVVPTVIGAILIICVGILLRMRKTREQIENVDEIKSVESLRFDFSTIKVATDDFSDANKLGQGGFGVVYKGKLSDGQEIAVKRLATNSAQGDQEFKNEVLLVAKLQHRNLVRLLGFCLEGDERLLIYEFVPNRSLDLFLFDHTRRTQLDWERRHKLIGGIARGILYLHEDSRIRIIHRDLKASNILLDAEMNPKISDFGMARLFVVDETQGNTSRIVGTYGYMAPEYAMHGQFSVKSDVFSFGVLVLELVSGQKNNCFRNGENIEDLLSYAWESWRKATAFDIIDPSIRDGSRTEIMRCIHIGLLCVQENVALRPTMASVVLMLGSYSLSLPVPSQPAFFMHSTIDPEMPLLGEHSSGTTLSHKSKDNSANFSVNEDSITELYPR